MKAKVIKTGEIVDVYYESQHGQTAIIYKESVFANGRTWSEDEIEIIKPQQTHNTETCVKMTQKEKLRFDEYGTAYPCCGNCKHIREAGFKLMCKKYLEYRDYDSVKCPSYKYEQNIQVLEELKG